MPVALGPVELALVALWLAGLGASAWAQDVGWYAAGEQLRVALPESAVVVSQTVDGPYFTEDYALEVDATGAVVTGLRAFTVQEGDPLSDASLLDASRTLRVWMTLGCPAMELQDRVPSTIAGRPGLTLTLSCPEDAGSDRAGETMILTTVSGEARLHSVILMLSPHASPDMIATHDARMQTAEFCDIEEVGGVCHVR